ncbi:MAG: hypothetical protein ACP5N7_03490 [Candidatus Pacearchaeota archaeon]
MIDRQILEQFIDTHLYYVKLHTDENKTIYVHAKNNAHLILTNTHLKISTFPWKAPRIPSYTEYEYGILNIQNPIPGGIRVGFAEKDPIFVKI